MQTITHPVSAAFRAFPIVRMETAQESTGAQCSSCRFKGLCLPGGLEPSDLALMDGMTFAQRRLQEGEALYHEGEDARFIYAVRMGTLKSSILSRDGREQVTGFPVAGEVLGLDGLATGTHASSVHALEASQVCTIHFATLCELARRSARVQQVITRLLSREIVREQEHMTLLGDSDAGHRLQGFLLNISRRMAERGYSASEFHLRMSRAEIGSYLGMTLETVSRAFSALQRQGVLEVDRKHVRIHDVQALAQAFETVD
ncbi:helix-turn-helix domain-containing protein [Ramlibacter sp. MMS24-I3-19]|uniref:helix-turn-helix domain-containing protein n=1 Tax=Ramlibacter sp. MMS24-I3-19 TaxID=3416606 RepID=UPI003CFE2F6D